MRGISSVWRDARIVSTLGMLLGLAACGTEPDERLLEGTYGTSYDPPQLVSATVNCDRLVSHAVLAVNTLGDFDLSINVTDDCSRAGGGFTFVEVLKLGKYSRRETSLTFTPDGEPAAAFTGELEGDFVRLQLPPVVGQLASTDVELRVGPRSPL